MGSYDDIIHLPHHRSKKRCHMSMEDRAAQFSPFAALTGFEAAISETGRLTDSRPELADYGTEQLDRMLRWLQDQLPRCPQVTITRFLPDQRKAGGSREVCSGRVKKIDLYGRQLLMEDGTVVALSSILAIESAEYRE